MKPGKRRTRLPSFVALTRETMRSDQWRKGLSSSEKVLYMHLKVKYVGYNNGEICLHYSELVGLMSKGTAWRAFKGLEEKGWIEKTKIGGLFRFINHYKLTGKYDNALIKYNF